MIVAILACHLGAISIENPGIRLELLLKDLSSQAGVGLHCTPTLNNEVIAASFKDQSVEVVKSQLARVVHANWEEKPDGWWLVQTSEQKQEEVLWHRELRRKAIQEIIDFAKQSVPQKEWTVIDAENYRRLEKAMYDKNGEHVYTATERRQIIAKSPSGRLSAGIGALLKPEMFPLDSMEPEYQVYTFNGGGIGRELNVNLSNCLAMFDREQYLYQSGTADIQANSDHVVLSMPNDLPLFPNITTYDKQWQISGYGGFSLPTANFKADGELFTPSKKLQEILDAMVYRRDIDPETGDVREDPKMQPIWDRISRTFANAATTDPLGLLHGQCWIDYAAETKKPMIANLCDSQTQREPKLFVPTVKQTRLTYYNLRDDADGWILGRPVDPLWNRTHRMDRFLLQNYVKLSGRGEKATVEETAMASDIGDYANTFCSGIPSIRLLNMTQPFQSEGKTAVIAYGAALRSGVMPDSRTGIIDLQRLPAYAVGSLRLAFLNSDLDQLAVEKGKYEGICPLILMPNGLKGVYLKVHSSIEPVFEVKDDEGDPMVLDLEYLADMIKDLLAEPAKLNQLPIKQGTRRQVLVSLCRGDRSIDEILTDPVGSMTSYTWSSLPANLKKMVMDRVNSSEPPPPRNQSFQSATKILVSPGTPL